MKILKDSTYEELLSYKERYKHLDHLYDALLLNLEQAEKDIKSLKKDHAFDVIIRRAFVGRKGSGKTEMVKQMLRKMHPNRYFVIDRHAEYSEFPAESKLVFNPELHTVDTFKDSVKSSIKSNLGKLIVIEDFGIYHYAPGASDFIKWFFETIGKGEFIIISQTSSDFFRFIGNIDLIYNTGCFDKRHHDKVTELYPNIYCDLSKKEVGELIKN